MKRTLIKALTVVLGVVVFICMLTTPIIASQRGSNPGIASIQSHPQGKSYGEWAKAFWKWRLETPYDINPAVNNNPCGGGQTGNVWFLTPDAFVDYTTPPGVQEFRTCTITADTSLFFPLINNAYAAFLTDPPAERTYDFVRKVTRCAGPVDISVKIDGERVDKPYQYYEESPFFTIHLPSNSIYKDFYPAMTWEPVADTGYYLFLRPLPVGKHKIEWTAEWYNCGYGQYVTPAMYFLMNYEITVTHH